MTRAFTPAAGMNAMSSSTATAAGCCCASALSTTPPASGSTATSLSTHEGGHTPFSADITALLDPSGRQKVTVRAFDDPHDLTKPRGKQDWQREPHAIWYPRTTGIWQTVWLERVGRTYVDRSAGRRSVESYAIRFEARIAGEPGDDLAIEVTLRHGDAAAGATIATR